MKKMHQIYFILFFYILIIGGVNSQTHIDFDNLDRYIGKAVSDFNLPGLSIAIVKDSSIVFKNAYGYKNIEKNEKLTTGSLFNIASCSKAVTAACIGLLVEEGKIRWDDKVIDYIPEFQLADPYITREMNIIDLLSHRSGLDTFDGDLLWYGTNYSNREIIYRMRYLPIRKDFRSEFGYQNNMYMIAGEIIHKVTGMSWSDFVYNIIFAPLEMIHSKTCSQHLESSQDIAFPHLERKTQKMTRYDPDPAGSIYSSVDEMSHWILMMLNNGRWKNKEVLNPTIIETLFTSRTIMDVSSLMKDNGTHFHTYGMGWTLFDYYGKKVVEHGGGMPGYISRVVLVPEEKLGMVILTNDMNSLPVALRYKVIDMFCHTGQKDWAKIFLQYQKEREENIAKRKSERAASRVKGTKSSHPLEGYCGLYRDELYGDARIELNNNKLILTLLPAKQLFTSVMIHWHYDTFRIVFNDPFLPEGFVTFNLNSSGEITNFKIDLPNPDFHFYNLNFQKIN